MGIFQRNTRIFSPLLYQLSYLGTMLAPRYMGLDLRWQERKPRLENLLQTGFVVA
jgi:hypothetical protein